MSSKVSQEEEPAVKFYLQCRYSNNMKAVMESRYSLVNLPSRLRIATVRKRSRRAPGDTPRFALVILVLSRVNELGKFKAIRAEWRISQR